MTAPDFGCKRALLLQGPNGPFFKRFGRELIQRGVEVTKVNFHAGDAVFSWGLDCIPYRGRSGDVRAFLERCLSERQIDIVYVFGDGRPYHRVAAELCRERGIRFFAFEEGYLRPDWITLEEHGVNGYSRMPRDPKFYTAFAGEHSAPRGAVHMGPTFAIGAWYATLLAVCATLAHVLYPHYRHHRSINFVGEMCRWLLGAARKVWFRWRERRVLAELTGPLNKRYYFVALQVHCDFQLKHSRFEDVESFMAEVMGSFARHAPRDTRLLIKHHPMDRAYREYGAWIRRAARELGIADRVIYVHDLHLPTLLRASLGSVMINSTVGLQSIEYGVPVKVLGDAVYDMPGLTHQGALEEFWRAPGQVDLELYRAFRTYLLCVNQANGSFAKPIGSLPSPTGIAWFPGPEASRRQARKAS